MKRLSTIGIALVFGLSSGTCVFAQSCPSEPSYIEKETTDMLTAEYAGSLLLISKPVFSHGSLVPSGSKDSSAFEDGCYSLDKKLQTKRLWFSINNHSKDTSTPAYVGIQIIKLFPRIRPSKSLLVAFRTHNRPWYFQKNPLAGPYTYRQWRYSLADWNDTANALSLWNTYDRAIFPIFHGYWHASSRANEPDAWDQRDWWHINTALENDYSVVLENRLISFEPASDEVGQGIPFYVTVGGAQAVIIRYYSSLDEQNGEVRFCFDGCEDIARLQLSPE